MNKKQIPDVAYEVDGDTVTIEQGWSEPVSVVLHKIHLKYLAEEMGVSIGVEEVDDPKLNNYLREICDMANELYQMLKLVPTYPPGSEVTDDVLLARELTQKAETALALWGDS